jgi:hypothetical protein
MRAPQLFLPLIVSTLLLTPTDSVTAQDRRVDTEVARHQEG